MRKLQTVVAAVLLTCSAIASAADAKKAELLNASYDIARELFTQVNPAFQAQWKAKTGVDVQIRQSHGGSSKQARSVAEGLQADVVTFNQFTDVDFLAKAGLVAADWQKRLPNNASPYYSMPVFLVRAGNPKKIKDWDDLARPGVAAVFPNPKTSGNGRYTYLGAYAFALNKNGNDDAKAKAFVSTVLSQVPVFDTGGRGSTTTFVERGIGDVLVTFEAEVSSIRQEYAKSNLQIVYPSLSVRADFPVAVVDKVVDRHGTRDVATAYLQFLYSEQGQDLLAKNFNRVRSPTVAARYKAQFPDITLVTVEGLFGGWDNVTKTHFSDGGVLDQILAAKK
jgi:sulfate/thiosulfate transport system substrate-binding protein